MKNQKNVVAAEAKAAPEAKPEIVLTGKVFEGTVAGHKFLFAAEEETLKEIAEIPAGKTAHELALELATELVSRAKANEKAVRLLYKAWVADKKAQKAQSPEGLALAARKASEKASKKAEALEAKAVAAKAKADAKAAKAQAVLDAAQKAADEAKKA